MILNTEESKIQSC